MKPGTASYYDAFSAFVGVKLSFYPRLKRVSSVSFIPIRLLPSLKFRLISDANPMQCPKCLFDDTKVLDSRVAADGYSIRRRRECGKCRFRFSTIEQMEILDLIVVKRNGERQPYSKDKLTAGIRLSLEKRPITQDAFKKLIAGIEQQISNSTTGNEITTAEIGNIVMKQLKKVDQVGYIRFASVYRQFKDVEEFRKELKKL